MQSFDPGSDHSHYRPAAICKRGHTQTQDLTLGEVGERCPTCGAKVLTGCPKCRTRIRGYYHVPGVTSFTGDYTPPRFCDSCGAPFPWLDRQGRIFELENMLDDEDLDDASELAVREQLRALADPDLDEGEERKRWEPSSVTRRVSERSRAGGRSLRRWSPPPSAGSSGCRRRDLLSHCEASLVASRLTQTHPLDHRGRADADQTNGTR
jgi:hypothetical protein